MSQNKKESTTAVLGPDGDLEVSGSSDVYLVTSKDFISTTDVVVVDVAEIKTIIVHLLTGAGAGTITGTFAVQGSIDSSNGTDGHWFTISSTPTNSVTSATTISVSAVANTPNAAANTAPVSGCRFFRLTCSAIAGGDIIAIISGSKL